MARFQMPKLGPQVLPSSFILQLLLAGLVTSLLTLAGGALLGAAPTIEAGLPRTCTAFQVGSPHAANTRIHLENGGPVRTPVQLDFVDQDGLYSQTIGYSPILDPGASSDFVFRTPPLGAAVKLSWPSRTMHASTEILRDDGAPPEIRTAIPCLPSDTRQGDRPNVGGLQGAAPTAPGLTVQT